MGIHSVIIYLLGMEAVLLLVYFYLVLSKPHRYKVREEEMTLGSLTQIQPLKWIIDKIVPKEDDREGHDLLQLMNDSGTRFSMRVIYMFRVLLPLIMFVVLFSVYITNKQIVVKAIIENRIDQKVDLFASSIAASAQKKKAAQEEALGRERDKQAYILVMKNIDAGDLLSMPENEAATTITGILDKSALYDESKLTQKSALIYNNIKRVNLVSSAHMGLFVILFISILGYYMPIVFLRLARYIRYEKFDNEVISLEMLVILAGTVENITVKEILKILRDNSRVFKPHFEKCLMEYPSDFEKALQDLGDSVVNKDFKNLVMCLRQCATSDRFYAIQSLKRRRLGRREYRKVKDDKKIEFKTYLGFIMLAPTLFLLTKLMLDPWQSLVNMQTGL